MAATHAPPRSLTAPNFFVVGAAKAGTTAMHTYLGRHPDIFMSAAKEPSFFATDLGLRTAWSADVETYLRLFADGAGATVRGESSAAYLFSPQAPRRIRDFAPDARILVMLRDPIEVAQALHSEARKFGIEPRRDFGAALRASDRGRSWPVRRISGPWLRYRELVHFADQVERYQRTFDAAQLHIELYDDFVADPAATYRRVLTFLGVDPEVTTSFRPENAYVGEVRSALVQLLLVGSTAAPGSDGLGNVRLDRLRRAVARRNVVPVARPALDPAVRADLVADLRPDVARLSALIGRDLSHWLADPAGST